MRCYQLLFPVLVLAAVRALAADGDTNVLRNGGFEDGQTRWAWNRSSSPAELEIVSGEPGREVHGGTQALLVRNRGGNTHIHQSGGKAETVYKLSVWARAGDEVKSADGGRVAPKLALSLYLWGRPEENNGRNKFIRSKLLQKHAPLTPNWRRFTKTFKVSEAEVAGVRNFRVALGIQGEVVVDDVVLAEVQTWRDRLLFHLPFDDGLSPAVAAGGATAEIRGDVRLVEGRKGKAGSFTDNAHLAFVAAGNFDQAEGTIALWIRPYWAENDGMPHCFFEVPVPPELALDECFVVTKGFAADIQPNRCYFYNSPNDHHISIGGGLFEPNEWVHLAFTWSTAARMLKLYRNGELISVREEKITPRPDPAGLVMVVGARAGGKSPDTVTRLARDFPASGGWGAEAALDELMLFKGALSAAEVAQLAGSEPPAEKAIAKRASAHINRVEMGAATPHIPLGRPRAGAPLQSLFVVPRVGAREVVELAQRYETDFRAVVVKDQQRFGFDDFGTRYADVSTEAKTAELAARLDEKPQVIVIGNFNWQKLPAPLRRRLLARVDEGAGLVLVNPVEPPTFNTTAPAGRDRILTGVPLAAMPDLYPEETLDAAARRANVVQPYTHGRGRVVVLRWYEKADTREALGPRSASGIPDRQFEHRYNYAMSLIGKAMDWAAQRDETAAWTALPADGAPLTIADWPAAGFPVAWKRRGQALAELTLRAVLRDASGRIENEQTVAVTPKAEQAVIALEPPRAGLHFLDLQLLSGGKAENWATVSFTLERRDRIAAVETERRHFDRGDTVAGTVRFRQPLSAPAILAVRALDTYGRIYAASSSQLERGTAAAPFSLPVAGTSSLASYLEADLMRAGTILSRGEVLIYVRKPRDSEFLAMVWATEAHASTLVNLISNRRLREAGFNAMYRWDYRGDFHSEALADMMPVQYTTKLKGHTRAGALLMRHPYFKLNYGIDDLDHSPANPVIRDTLQGRVAARAKASMPLAPWWYSLGDENYFERGFGYSPYGLQYFRDFLARRYGTIAALNREYGADYAGFVDVPRWRRGSESEALPLPAMLDHELCVDDEWVAVYQCVVDGIRRLDPTARVGAEGSDPGDIERMLETVQVWAPYAGTSPIQLRSLGADTLRSHWWGGYGEGAPHAGLLWNWLIQGRANFHQFFSADSLEGLFNRNLTCMDYFKNLLPDLREIHGGLGLLLAGAHMISDRDVVIHYSRTSYHASQFHGNLARTSSTDKAFCDALQGLAQDFRYVSARLIAAGKRRTPRARLLFLPASYCLSEPEAEGIAAFVRAGGTVVADVLPGVLNEYGRRLPAGRLDTVFGAACSGPSRPTRLEDLIVTGELWGQSISLGLGMGFCDSAVQPAGGTAVKTVGDMPVIICNEYGAGKAVLLNFDIARAPGPMAAKLVQAVLAAAGVKPVCRLEGVPALAAPVAGGGARLDRNVVSAQHRGNAVLIGAVLPGGKPGKQAEVIWDMAQHTYNVRTGEYLGWVDRARLAPVPPTGPGERAQAYLFSLHREPLRGISLAGPDTIRPGETLALDIALDTGGIESRDRLLRLDVIDPSGTLLPNLRQFVTLDRDAVRAAVHFAFNDASGNWVLRVTDLVTGTAVEKTIQLL